MDHIIDDRNALAFQLLPQRIRDPIPNRKQAIFERTRKTFRIHKLHVKMQSHYHRNKRTLDQRTANYIHACIRQSLRQLDGEFLHQARL